MTIALYIGAAVLCIIAFLCAATGGRMKEDGVGFILWLICTIGAAAMLIAGVTA